MSADLNNYIAHLPDRALSIRQPWAWAIMNAGKRVENRSQRWKYRGRICIHASLHKPTLSDMETFDIIVKRVSEKDSNVADRFASNSNITGRLGGIIGTAEIVDVVTESDSPWFFGPYGYVLENVQPVPFTPVKGALGLFKWKDRLA